MIQGDCLLCRHPLPTSWLSGNMLGNSHLHIFRTSELLCIEGMAAEGSGAETRFLLKTLAHGPMVEGTDWTSLQGVVMGNQAVAMTFLNIDASELLFAVLCAGSICVLDYLAADGEQESDTVPISARRHHALHRIGASQLLVVGGLLNTDYPCRATALSDFYIVDVVGVDDANLSALTVSGPFLLPYPIAGCTISSVARPSGCDQEANRHILIGGYIDCTECNRHALEYVPADRAWRELGIDLSAMTPRHSHSMITLVDRYIVIYGGFTAASEPLYDLWVIDVKAEAAQSVDLLVETPRLFGCSLYYSAASDDLFLLSGRSLDTNKPSTSAYVIQQFASMLNRHFNASTLCQSSGPVVPQSMGTSPPGTKQTEEKEVLQQTVRFLQHRLNTLEISYLKHVIAMREALVCERQEKQRLLAVAEKQATIYAKERRNTLVASLSQTSSMQISLSQVDALNMNSETSSNKSPPNSQPGALNLASGAHEPQGLIAALLDKISRMEHELATITTRLDSR